MRTLLAVSKSSTARRHWRSGSREASLSQSTPELRREAMLVSRCSSGYSRVLTRCSVGNCKEGHRDQPVPPRNHGWWRRYAGNYSRRWMHAHTPYQLTVNTGRPTLASSADCTNCVTGNASQLLLRASISATSCIATREWVLAWWAVFVFRCPRHSEGYVCSGHHDLWLGQDGMPFGLLSID